MMFIKTSNNLIYINGSRNPYKYGSGMGRDILSARIKYNGHYITVLTSHFESCKEAKIQRCQQFKEIHNLMTVDEAVIFCGDTNFSTSDNVKDEVFICIDICIRT
jgi:NAD dependent epimerase/dehydratase family enzyme